MPITGMGIVNPEPLGYSTQGCEPFARRAGTFTGQRYLWPKCIPVDEHVNTLVRRRTSDQTQAGKERSD